MPKFIFYWKNSISILSGLINDEYPKYILLSKLDSDTVYPNYSCEFLCYYKLTINYKIASKKRQENCSRLLPNQDSNPAQGKEYRMQSNADNDPGILGPLVRKLNNIYFIANVSR